MFSRIFYDIKQLPIFICNDGFKFYILHIGISNPILLKLNIIVKSAYVSLKRQTKYILVISIFLIFNISYAISDWFIDISCENITAAPSTEYGPDICFADNTGERRLTVLCILEYWGIISYFFKANCVQ